MGARLLQAGGGVPFRNSILNDPEVQQGREDAGGMAGLGGRFRQDQQAGLPVVIPVTEFRDIVGAALTATSSGADPATELKKAHGAVQADPGAQREGVSAFVAMRRSGRGTACCRAGAGVGGRRPYWPFVVPALVVVVAIIVFPWVFTIWMSLNEWKVGSPTDLRRPGQLYAADERSPLH